MHNQAVIHWACVSGNLALLIALLIRNRGWKLTAIQSVTCALILLQNLLYYGVIPSAPLGQWLSFDFLCVCLDLAFTTILIRHHNWMAWAYVAMIALFLYEYSLADDGLRVAANHVYWWRIWYSAFVVWMMAGVSYKQQNGKPVQRTQNGSNHNRISS